VLKKVPYFGLALSEQHKASVLQWIESRVFSFMKQEGSPLYHSWRDQCVRSARLRFGLLLRCVLRVLRSEFPAFAFRVRVHSTARLRTACVCVPLRSVPPSWSHSAFHLRLRSGCVLRSGCFCVPVAF